MLLDLSALDHLVMSLRLNIIMFAFQGWYFLISVWYYHLATEMLCYFDIWKFYKFASVLKTCYTKICLAGKLKEKIAIHVNKARLALR